MASQNRNERQLMRQRGAGNRDIAPANFGLSFDFESGRQARQQMRQRGAAARKVGLVEFGLNLPPVRSRQSRSATPASRAGSNSTRISKAVSRRSREPSVPRERSVSTAPEGESLNPAKRRKIGARPASTRNVSEGSGLPTGQATTVFPIVEDAGELQPTPAPARQQDVSPAQLPVSPLFMPQDDYEKENAAPSEAKPMKKRRKKKSIIPAALRKKKRSSGAPTNSDLQRSFLRRESAQPEQEQQYRDGKLDGQIEAFDENRPAAPEIPAESIENDLFNTNRLSRYDNHEDSEQPVSKSTTPRTRKRRKKKKSVILVKPRKRKSNESTSSVVVGSSMPRTQSTSIPLPKYHDASIRVSDAEEHSGPCRPARTRSRLETTQSLGSSPSMRRDADEDSEEDYNPDDYSPEPETPAPTRKILKSTHQTLSRRPSANASDGPLAKRKKQTFPIITHRMTNTIALPIIQEEGSVDLDHQNDSESHHRGISSFIDRPTPNCIDVLSQICREVIDRAISCLPQTQDSTANRKRKSNALEAFGDDLGNRLFDMSNAVENRMTLESHVRRTKREKTDLQAQWIEVRKQRERMALKCDRVRRYHWENGREREEKWEISEAANKAELELGRGEDVDEESIEFLLKSVAKDVGGKEQIGLLDRIKAFNGQLERMAGVLEGRD